MSADDRFRQLVEAAPDAIVLVDRRGEIVLVNREAERLFGYGRADLVGRPVELLLPERYRRDHVEYRMTFAASPSTRPMGSGLDLHARRKDGTELPVEISLSPIETPEGRLFASSIRDVSARRQIERAMRRAHSYLRSAVESVPDVFALYDENDQLILCNSAARQLLGTSFEGAVEGRSFEELAEASLRAGAFDCGPEGPERWRERRLAYHRAPAGVLELRAADGCSLRVTERRTAEGGTVVLVADVSNDVAHEAELRHAREQAEAASAAKTEFLSSMSHELRTPLNAVLGFAQLLRRDKKTPLTDRQQERLGHVLKGGEHLLRLIDQVLDLARIEAGRATMSVEPVGVPEVLAEVTATLGPMAAQAEVRLAAEPLPPELPLAYADRTRLAQILMNFGSNAIKYGRKGGHSTFRIEAASGALRLSVHDDGIGVPDEHQPKLFEPFQRAGQETGPIEGTGIGLAISKRLAELMGGRVGFESKAGEGSTFWVEVPAHRERTAPDQGPCGAEAAASPLASPLAAPGPRHLVVYIEDNPSNVAFMHELVDDLAGIELATAPTAEIGLELVRSRRPAVVLMDINLPGISGFEATRRLREWPDTRDTPVVALTAAAMPRDAELAAETGFYRYLTKPVKVDELTRVLEELLASNAP